MSRQHILNTIKKNKPSLTEYPNINIADSDIDVVNKFQEMVKISGAGCIEISSKADIKAKVTEFTPDLKIENIYCQIPELGLNTMDMEKINTPHDLEAVDLVVIEGGIAVAENGAIWVTDEEIKFRAAWYITQHLAIIVKKENIVANMQEGYQNIEVKRPGFGCFISGPSKTADIEQSLVIGAHGARSLTVFLI
jgi:L-lactate dehydrogenase complex protein LldG